MQPNDTHTVPAEVLAKIRKHAQGAEGLNTRVQSCHYCGHKTIIIYEDARGHVQAKCKHCGKESLYNVLLRRNRPYHSSFLR